eukprot:sb/3463014/
MDQYIRSQLLSAVQNKDNGKLKAAYEKIKSEGEINCFVNDCVVFPDSSFLTSLFSAGASETLSPDLFVICAESAITINLIANHDLINEALTFYITLKPKENQFLARSYLCHAHLNKPMSTRDTEKLEKCTYFIHKAVTFGLQNSRYHFIVVNASILFWKLVRPFLVLQSIHKVVGILGIIVKALNQIDDNNKKWILSVTMAYIESLYRSNQFDAAVKETKAALKLARSQCQEVLPELVSKLSNYGLVLGKDVDTLPLNLILVYEINTFRARESSEQDKGKGKKNLDGIIGRVVEGRNEEKLDPDTANDLLLEILLISLQHRQSETAQTALDEMRRPFTDVDFEFRVKFAEADLIIKKLGAEEQSYKKSVLTVRLKAVTLCQEALTSCISESAAATVQSGCVTLWNLILPLLQPNLRQRVLGPLKLIASALEGLQSMLVLLRCQVHMELAKCFQDQERLIEALENFNKALHLDPDGQYKENIMYHIKCINLKTNLYKKPDTLEEKAGFLLEQAKSAHDAKARLQPLLLQVGEYLAPNTFNWGLKELGENSQNCSSLIVLKDKITKFREAKEKGKSEMNRLADVNTHERFILWSDVAKLARRRRYGMWHLLPLDSLFGSRTGTPSTPV